MSALSWRFWSRNNKKSPGHTQVASEQPGSADRRQLLQALSAIAGSGALSVMA
jgi:hypothetical protein